MRLPSFITRAEEDEETTAPATDSAADGHRDPAVQQGPSLSAALAESVNFHLAEPWGYYHEQVDTFVAQTQEALTFWEEDDYQKRRRIHELETELEHQVYDVNRLRTEIEMFRVQGDALVNPDGSYVTESQGGAATAEVERLTGLYQQAEAARVGLEAELNTLRQFSGQQTAELEELRAWADQVIVQFEEVQATAAEKTSSLADAEALIESLRAENDALRASASSPAPVAALAPVAMAPVAMAPVDMAPPEFHGASAYTPTPEPVHQPVSEDRDSAAYPQDQYPVADQGYQQPEQAYYDNAGQAHESDFPDSELPPGVSLPQAAPVNPYAPAAPGAPLSTISGPVDQWAPELSEH